MKRKILVVDDEENMRETLADVLRMKGYQVVMASNGLEAAAVANVQLPDLILMDYNLPRIKGDTVARQLKQVNPRTKGIPIILISGESFLEKRAKEVGCEAFLSKPLDNSELLALVKKLLK